MNQPGTNSLTRPAIFSLPDQANRDYLISHLQHEYSCEIEPVICMERIYYDSFDWRLYLHNLCLYRDQSRNSSRYVLQSNSNHAVIVIQEMNSTAVFIEDFAPGPIRNKLSPILEMRALLPLVSIHQEIIPVRILNKAKKTIVQLRLDHNRIRKPASSKPETKTVRFDDFHISVMPMRGYPKQALEICHALEKIPGLLPGRDDLFDWSMRSMERVPGDYSSKLNIQLDAQDRTYRVLQRILKNLYHTMQLNEAGVISNIDTEFLHDYRVAVRKTRSALSQIKHVLPERQVEKFRKAFSWLGTITNPCRDLDVHLLKYDEYVAILPEGMRNDLEPLKLFLQHQRKREYAKLKKSLSSPRYRQFKKSWSAFLDSDLSTAKSATNAEKPVKTIARKTLWRAYNRVLKQGALIESVSPATQYHELRKTCKKLRYLLDFFASLIPQNEIGSLIKTLKLLQDNLGDFQNLQIHTESLKSFTEKMQKKEKVSSVTLAAMNALTENFDRNKIEVRDQFSKLYRIFRNRKNQGLFNSLFSPDEKKQRTER